MDFRNVGASGLKVSTVGLGCNNFGWHIDEQQTATVVSAAIDAGITLFDTADVYGNKGLSEEYLGRALGARRQDIVLATKFGITMGQDRPAGASRRYIVEAVEASLRRLQTDWIDLYQLHRPDPDTPIEETLRALDDLIRAGKVRYAGLSEMPAWEFTDAQWTARHSGFSPLVSAQYEYSLLARDVEREILPAMRHQGLGLLPYFPLASGMLTGKYRRDCPPTGRLKDFSEHFLTDRNWTILEQLEQFAAERGLTLLQIAFGWLLAKAPVASVIAGVSRPEQILGNVDAVNWTPTCEEVTRLDEIASPALTSAPI